MAVGLSVLRADRPLSPEALLVLISVRGWVDLRAIVRPEGLGKLENPMISLDIEPAIFRLIALRLNQLCYLIPFAHFSTYCHIATYLRYGKIYKCVETLLWEILKFQFHIFLPQALKKQHRDHAQCKCCFLFASDSWRAAGTKPVKRN
jgi:hypothetical protein